MFLFYSLPSSQPDQQDITSQRAKQQPTEERKDSQDPSKADKNWIKSCSSNKPSSGSCMAAD